LYTQSVISSFSCLSFGCTSSLLKVLTGLIVTGTWCFFITRNTLSDMPSTYGNTIGRRLFFAHFSVSTLSSLPSSGLSLSWMSNPDIRLWLTMPVGTITWLTGHKLQFWIESLTEVPDESKKDIRIRIHIRKEGRSSMNRDEGSYILLLLVVFDSIFIIIARNISVFFSVHSVCRLCCMPAVCTLQMCTVQY